MANNRPFVAALVCEKVLLEKDEVPTIVRMVDTYFIPKHTPNDIVALVATTLFVALKSDQPMEGEVSFSIHTPDGTSKEMPQKWPMSFSGEISGANVILHLALHPRHIGLSWVDVLWNGEVVTRAPIRLVVGEKSSAEVN